MIAAGVEPAQHVKPDGTAVLWVPGRPALLNAERSGHWRQHRATTATDRQTGWVLGQRLKVAGWRAPSPALIASRPVYRTRRSWPDVGNWLPAVKGLVDGLVDAGCWPDDTHRYVACLVFDSPMLGGADGLAVSITAANETEGNE